MSKIISVHPVPEHFSITWMLGPRCNYDCMYCPDELHDSTSIPHDLETMQQAWVNIYQSTKKRNLQYKISFSGGEVTANKNFLPLVEWLRNNYNDIDMIVVTTNGSASLNYYTRLANQVEAISFSTHTEFFNEHEFFTKAEAIDQLMVRPRKSFHVNIMNEYWAQDRIILYKARLDQKNISNTINEIDYTRQSKITFQQKGVWNLV